MILNKIKLYVYQLIYSQIKHTKIMTQNMRSPGNGFLGNVARELMIIFNEFVYNDSVNRLNIRKNDKIIEIGSHSELITRKGYYKKLYEVQFEKKDLFTEIF